MRKFEVAVLGLGLMGGAALGALLHAGVDALGFAPAIGQRLARLATDPSYEAEPFFQLSRYSCLSGCWMLR